MKKRIIILIVVLSLLIACTSNDPVLESTPSNSLVINQAKDTEDIEIELTISTDASHGYIFEDEWKSEVVSWQEELSLKYGVVVSLNYISAYRLDTFINGTYLEEAIKDDGLSGLIQLKDYEITNLAKLIDLQLILPLDEYLVENKAFNNLPGYLLNPYIINDKLYAIPAGNSGFPSIRLISKELLAKTQQPIPKTLSEYYEVLVDIKSNGDSVPMVTNDTGNYVYNIKDLFYANGCYPSFTGFSSISYDPLTNAVEDYMLKPGALETYQYIDHLIGNQLLQIKNVDSFDHFSSDARYGSYYGEMTEYSQKLIDDYDIIWYLEGSNNKFLNVINPSEKVYVLSKNTIQAKETVNAFVNTFLLNEEGYYLGYFGQKDVKYKKNDYEVHAIEDEDRMEIMNSDINYLSNGITSYSSDGLEYYKNINELTNVTEQLLKDDLLFSTSEYSFSFNARDAGWIHSWFFEIFMNSRGTVDVQEIIDEYVDYAKTFGGKDSLDQLNKLYGTSAMYDY